MPVYSGKVQGVLALLQQGKMIKANGDRTHPENNRYCQKVKIVLYYYCFQ